ncbi:MAG: hypothetical protein GY863_15745 [bacterium]|nr:hypothetical protein [bacterium]
MFGKRLLLVLFSAFLLIQCAGGGATTASRSGYKKTLGDFRKAGIRLKSRNLIVKNGFEIEREEGVEDDDIGDIYINTRWKTRTPFEDEKANNIISARTRITIRGRSSQRSLNMTSGERLFKVEFDTEGEVMIQGQNEWVKQPYSVELTAYLQKLCDELTVELRFTR